jgi:sugar phosphate isomerase/epimerase
MKVSVFTVQTPQFDLEETIIQLQQAGYDGVEWRVSKAVRAVPDPLPPRAEWYWKYNKSTIDCDTILDHVDSVKKLCEKHEITPFALSTYLTPDQTDKIEHVLRAASLLGSSMVRINPYQYNGQTHYQILFEKMRAELCQVELLARHYNVQVNLEIHMGNIMPSASAARRLLDSFDPTVLGVIYDPGNMVHEGFEQYQMGMELLGPYLHHIHIKDARWMVRQDDQHQTYQIEWCPVGTGVVRFDALMKAIRAVNYDGYLSFEDFSNESSDTDKLLNNLEWIKALIQTYS